MALDEVWTSCLCVLPLSRRGPVCILGQIFLSLGGCLGGMFSEDMRSMRIRFRLTLDISESKPCVCRCMGWVKSELDAWATKPSLSGPYKQWGLLVISSRWKTPLVPGSTSSLPGYRALLRLVGGTPGSALSCWNPEVVKRCCKLRSCARRKKLFSGVKTDDGKSLSLMRTILSG